VMGTAQYISPEQVSGKPASPLSDIYALGIVAYECLAGHPPFTADTPLALALAHSREPPPPLPDSVPPAVRELVECMLAKDPQERPSSAAEVSQWAQRLRAALNGGDATEALGLVSATAATAVVPAQPGPPTGDSTPVDSPHSGAQAQTWPPPQGKDSDRVAETSAAPNSRLNLPVVFALIATVGAVAVGIFLVGLLGKEPGTNGAPTSHRSVVPTLSRSPDTTENITTDSQTPVPDNPGGQLPPLNDEPEESYSPAPHPEPTTPPQSEYPSPPGDGADSTPDPGEEPGGPSDEDDADGGGAAPGGPTGGTGEESRGSTPP